MDGAGCKRRTAREAKELLTRMLASSIRTKVLEQTHRKGDGGEVT
jgi:hypothetical protein